MSFTWGRFSRKQLDVIANATARLNILDGSVRSGKTVASLVAWIKFVAEAPPGELLMVGKTERTLKRNILDPLEQMVGSKNFRLNRGEGEATLFGRRIYLAGANDERAEGKIRGMTLAGAYGDEITLWPESFFTMLLSRLSVPGARFIGTTNPDSPYHWLKTNYLDRAEGLNLKRWHFTLEDNPNLDPAYIEALKKEYTGLWYKRFILGLWVMAQGVIYDMFDEAKHKIPTVEREYSEYHIAVDYGTQNSTTFGLWGKCVKGEYAGKWIKIYEGGPIPHYRKGDEDKNWGKVPFIPWKNNHLEYPDIRFVKSLVDAYDKARSDIANFIEETKNLIYVLKGYGGENLSEFMSDLNYYRAIKIDEPEHGGVDTLTPKIDIQAAKEHCEQLKQDINEFGQGVPKDLDKYGNSPSRTALKFLYAGLDLKCNHLEVEFKQAFNQLLYFVNIYLAENGQGNYEDENVELIFNRDIQINEAETINNIVNSKGIVSDKTLVANHPWVSDVEEELKQIEKERRADEPPMFEAGDGE